MSIHTITRKATCVDCGEELPTPRPDPFRCLGCAAAAMQNVLAPAPDTRPLADEKRETLLAEQGETSRPLDLDPTFPAWQAIHAGRVVFERRIEQAATVEELQQLRDRVEILHVEFDKLSKLAGRLADAVIARRS